MIYAELNNEILNSPIRTNKARVELLEGSTLLQTFTYQDAMISFDIQRVGEGKFFGFGICQRLNVHLRDLERKIEVSTANNLDISFGAEHNYIYPYPSFKVSEVHRDENTNELSITAYDALYGAAERYVSEIRLNNYSIREFAVACATLLGLPLRIIDVPDESVFDARYAQGANFEGSETIREALNAIAEATQTIYYVSANWELVFRRLDKDGEPVATIDKSQYIELKNRDNRRLANVCHATELGDNYISTRRGFVEGNPVVITDCSAGKPLEITLDSNGETLGKNLFDYTLPRFNGASHFENQADGVIQVRGNAAKWASANISVPVCEKLVGKTITISAKIKTSGANNASVRLMWLTDAGGGGGSSILASPYVSSTEYVDMIKTGVVPEQPSTEHKHLCLMLYSNVDATVDSGTYYAWYKDIQIEIGDTATEYEPYSNTYGIAGIEVRASGKNLFDLNDFASYANSAEIGSSVELNKTYLDRECSILHPWRIQGSELYKSIKFKENTRYTFSVECAMNYNNNEAYAVPLLYIYFTDGTGIYLPSTGKLQRDSFTKLTYTTPANKSVRDLAIPSFGSSASVYFIDLQIEEGTTATEYEDYAGPEQVAYADAEGRVEGLVSYTPSTIITASHPNAIIKTKYLKPQLTGTVQYVRDNPFWELREDIEDVVDAAGEAMYGITINQFECNWRGNYLLEIGDKIGLVSKDDTIFYSYLLDDTIEYDGVLSEKTQWAFEENEGESADNPTSLGDVLKQTYAKVDKANKQIDLVASEATSNSEAIAQLQLTTEGISASVSSLKASTDGAINDINANIKQLNTNIQQTAEDIQFSINRLETKDAESITTSTGFTFNKDGLRVSKSESSIETLITEDGMTVYNGNKAVLTANNEGVQATDLWAKSYLIIGDYSRMENYGKQKRTACYWIGG